MQHNALELLGSINGLLRVRVLVVNRGIGINQRTKTDYKKNYVKKFMFKKEDIIHDWEYLKNQLVLFGNDYSPEEMNKIYKTAKAVFDKAVSFYGFSWAKEHLKPIDYCLLS